MREKKSTKKIISKINSQLKHLKNKGVFKNKEIVIFGCTMWLKILVEFFNKNNYTVRAIIDNNPKKADGKCMGIDVYLPCEYLKKNHSDYAIVICSSYYYEMGKQLEQMGYCQQKDFFVISHSIAKIPSIFQGYINVYKGLKIYRKYISKLTGKNPYVFVCPYGGSGDIYMASIFFQEYIKQNNIDDYVFLVENKISYNTSRLFALKNTYIISESEKILLLDAWSFWGSEKMHVKPLLYWGWRTKRFLNPDSKLDITFLDMIKNDVYNFESKIKPEIPQNLDSNFVDIFFKENMLEEGNTVILSPYAGSYKNNISVSIWENIVVELKKRGYCVYTNSCGDTEPVIKGTKPIFFPLINTVEILNRAGYFIGVRSGFADIASSSSCKMIVIYERALNAVEYNFFSFVKMGLKSDAVELIYDSDNPKFIEEQVISEFN